MKKTVALSYARTYYNCIGTHTYSCAVHIINIQYLSIYNNNIIYNVCSFVRRIYIQIYMSMRCMCVCVCVLARDHIIYIYNI